MTSVTRVEGAKAKTETLSSERGQPSATAAPHEMDQISEDRTRERAYLIWLEEGQPDGEDQEHWTRARNEIERDAR